MRQGASVIVAGAGALGLSSALAMADAGCAVRVFDPAEQGRASAVAAGMLAPVFEALLDPETADELDLLLSARNLWPAVAARAGVSIDRAGTAAVGSEAWLAGLRAGLDRLGMRGTDLPCAMLADLAPGLSPGLQGLLVREDWRLEPRPALDALRRAAEAAGVQFAQEAVRDRGAADWLVVATGADHSLLALVPELAELASIKGQILRYADVRGGPVSLRGEGAYAVPGLAGLALGATMEAGLTDATPDMAALAPLVLAAERLLPGLRGATFAVSAGIRAATPDGLPLVGLSATPGVILAVGARRNGWLLAPLVGQIVAACVTGRDAGPYARRLAPGRFAAGRAA